MERLLNGVQESMDHIDHCMFSPARRQRKKLSAYFLNIQSMGNKSLDGFGFVCQEIMVSELRKYDDAPPPQIENFPKHLMLGEDNG